MAAEWKVPRPSGVISSRDLARNASSLLTGLKEVEHSLLIVRHGLPAAVISSIPDPAWRPAHSVIRTQPKDAADELAAATDDEDPSEVLEGLELSASHRGILEALSDGCEWVPDAIATTAAIDQAAGALGFLEIRLLIIRRFGYYRISKKGMEVLQALRILDARERDGSESSENSAQG